MVPVKIPTYGSSSVKDNYQPTIVFKLTNNYIYDSKNEGLQAFTFLNISYSKKTKKILIGF